MDTHNIREELVSRFFRYVAVESQSDPGSPCLPSSSGQKRLADLLAEELRRLALEDVVVDDNAIVTAVKRGHAADAPKIGFMAHLDTIDIGLSATIRPQLFHFEGGDFCINPEQDIWIRADECPGLAQWKGEDIITSDGTSVLGADNKAAIAIIMTLLARLGALDIHGDIHVAFVPDEEIGLLGAKALDPARFPCDFAYTIDCCELGEVMLETFNAASCEITFSGVSAHPMNAKDVLVNPLLMAVDLIAQFDRRDTPEATNGREGFFWFKDLSANESTARLQLLIRDFDRSAFELRKQECIEAIDKVRARHPRGAVEVQITDTYFNIADALATDDRASTILCAAVDELGIKIKPAAMRGGTDGAVLSARGIPTPNVFTGAHNFHSRLEFLPVSAFEKSFQVSLKICELAAKTGEHACDSGRVTGVGRSVCQTIVRLPRTAI